MSSSPTGTSNDVVAILPSLERIDAEVSAEQPAEVHGSFDESDHYNTRGEQTADGEENALLEPEMPAQVGFENGAAGGGNNGGVGLMGDYVRHAINPDDYQPLGGIAGLVPTTRDLGDYASQKTITMFCFVVGQIMVSVKEFAQLCGATEKHGLVFLPSLICTVFALAIEFYACHEMLYTFRMTLNLTEHLRECEGRNSRTRLAAFATMLATVLAEILAMLVYKGGLADKLTGGLLHEGETMGHQHVVYA